MNSTVKRDRKAARARRFLENIQDYRARCRAVIDDLRASQAAAGEFRSALKNIRKNFSGIVAGRIESRAQ